MPDQPQPQGQLNTEHVIPVSHEQNPHPNASDPQPAVSDTALPNPASQTVPQVPSVGDGPNGPATPGDLTPDQQKFIHHWSFGPISNYVYFWAMDAWKVGILFILLQTIGTYVIFFVVALAAGFGYKALNIFGGTGSPFYFLTFGTGGVVAIMWAIGLTVWGMRKGRSIAWSHRQWVSYDNFVEVQKKWDLAGKIFLILGIIWFVITIVTALPGLMLLATNPTERIDQAQDSVTKLTTQRVATAMEACHTANNDSYTPCGSVSKLQSQNYLTSTTSSNDNQAMIDVSQDGKTAMVTAQASSTATCDSGSGTQKYYVYRSTTGKTQVECGSAMPMISTTTMPDMNMSNSPTPTSTGSMMY